MLNSSSLLFQFPAAFACSIFICRAGMLPVLRKDSGIHWRWTASNEKCNDLSTEGSGLKIFLHFPIIDAVPAIPWQDYIQRFFSSQSICHYPTSTDKLERPKMARTGMTRKELLRLLDIIVMGHNTFTIESMLNYCSICRASPSSI